MRVFTYGTLMRGQLRNEALTHYGGEFLREDEVDNYELRNIGGQFPAAFEKQDSTIKGEVFQFRSIKKFKACLKDLDLIEGVKKKLYKRVVIRTATGLDAFMYVALFGPKMRKYHPVIEGGDWRTICPGNQEDQHV